MPEYVITPDEAAQEIWLPVHGWESWYEVSDFGRIRRSQGSTAGGLLKPAANGAGYLQVTLHRPGVALRRSVHRLVALAFLGVPPENMEVNHRDGDRANPRRTNLEYVTRSGNMLHASTLRAESGRKVRANGIKLTVEQVREIRESEAHHDTLQWKYGVSAQYIREIRLGKARQGV